ncbi:MAG TPA: NAD(P)H-hydrate dehydratase [Thermoanaerobaculia bacterium]|nr:NAD(P)H-hydrate dehydratase [Thermoanaerobaculia bacterium]
MIPVLGSRAMRAADAAAIRGGIPSDELMENAASALARAVRRGPCEGRVTVVCGPGQNGGDGLAAARLLALAGHPVLVFTLAAPGTYRGDAARNLERAAAIGLAATPLTARGAFRELARALAESDRVIDALFGTGLSRPLADAARRAVAAINASDRHVVAADLPSGLYADRGDAPAAAVRARETVAFGAPKPCHVLPPATDLCGSVEVADIGIPRAVLEAKRSRLSWTEDSDVRALLPPRPIDSNKGNFGRLAIVAGSRGKAGAALLAARGALRAGAGLVTVFCAESLADALWTALPEVMTRPLPEEDGAISAAASTVLERELRGFDAVVAGPGLSTSAGAVAALEAVVRARIPLVADADALNAFAGRPSRFRRRAPTILTPHPGEAGRLLGRSAADVQADRLRAARGLAQRARSVVLLKGARTLVAEPDGTVAVNPTGTPLLATAGSGDVLSGILGALLAGGLAPRDAAVAGAWLHGAAAQSLTPRLGDAGLLSHEVADAVPGVRRALRAEAEAETEAEAESEGDGE